MTYTSSFTPFGRASVLLGALFLCATLPACDTNEDNGPSHTVVSGSGDITARVAAFRALLGEPLNTTPGPYPSGRRELTWDGVPDEFAAPNNLPSDFFLGRGARLTTPGTAVQVSADEDNPSGAALRFGHINPGYSDIFKTFSPQRLFSPIGSNIVDLTFYVPGTNTPAVVRGFGAVYTDVDAPENTAFEYFDADGNSLGRFDTPVSNDGLSFLGVVFPEPVIHRVRIGYGNTALGPDDGGTTDVAVMDDFFYDEPQPVR